MESKEHPQSDVLQIETDLKPQVNSGDIQPSLSTPASLPPQEELPTPIENLLISEVASPAPAPAEISTPPVPQPQPVSVQPETKMVFEIAAAPLNPSELSYACVLIPRFSDHYLTGDITQDLGIWLREVCVSYGWRLEAAIIQPGYLHWVMAVPLSSNPARFMKVVRQQTSQKIFEEYPRFKRKNLSLDFWAPSFSVAHGNMPQSLEDINAFILLVRRQQGILP